MSANSKLFKNFLEVKGEKNKQKKSSYSKTGIPSKKYVKF